MGAFKRLSNVVYDRMFADQNRREAANPGGHSLGDDSAIQRDRPDPDTGPSDKPQPEPATTRPTPVATAPLTKKRASSAILREGIAAELPHFVVAAFRRDLGRRLGRREEVVDHR